MKVHNSFAPDTFEVLVGFEVGVVPFGVARAFDGKGQAQIAQGQQRPIDRVQRDAGKAPADLAEDGLGRGVFVAPPASS